MMLRKLVTISAKNKKPMIGRGTKDFAFINIKLDVKDDARA